MSHDRRKGRRHEAPPLVAYYWDGASPVAHRIRDISSVGFYLLTEQRWYVGTLVTMTLQRTGGADAGSELSIAVQARVVRLGADGVGLAFVLRPSQDHKDRQAGRSPQELAAIGADKRTLDRFLRPLLAERVVGPGGELARISSSREPGREVMKILGGESGQATIFAVLSMTVLLGFVGFAADVGVLLHTKRNVQTAADSAAIAGAAELGYTDLTYGAAGQAAATQNGFTNGVNGAVVTINNPPLYGAHAGQAGIRGGGRLAGSAHYLRGHIRGSISREFLEHDEGCCQGRRDERPRRGLHLSLGSFGCGSYSNWKCFHIGFKLRDQCQLEQQQRG